MYFDLLPLEGENGLGWGSGQGGLPLDCPGS